MDYDIKQSLSYLDYMQDGDINSLLAKVLDFKNIKVNELAKHINPEFVYHDFSLFHDSIKILDRIHYAIEHKQKICIYGDYDCDGILATSILVDAFKQLSVDVGYYIPDRIVDGYGLNVHRVQQMASKGYNLIITVDNGVKAFDAVEEANKSGIDVIITDHHHIEDSLPNAYAILHTKLSKDYPFKEISGGVVAYKLATALLSTHDKYLYTLACITTLSDMMPLVDENKTMVLRGLEHMEQYDYPQLRKLLTENQKYNTTSLGFNMIPKINAFGRLCDIVQPSKLVPYFVRGMSDELLDEMSVKAEQINTQRKTITNSTYAALLQEIDSTKPLLFLYNKEIHEGIVGLIAGKYTNQFNKHSFVMTFDKRLGLYKGSARGIDELSLIKIFEHVSYLLEGFGGHQLAGGFSVKSQNIEALENAITQYIEKEIKDVKPKLKSCLEINFDDLTIENIQSLRYLEPYGMANEEVSFCLKDLLVRQTNILSNGKHLKYTVEMNNKKIDLLYFNCETKMSELTRKMKIDVIGKLSISTYRNIDTMNFIIDDIL